MKPALSIYLDATRFIAALVVFLAHFGLQHLSGGALWQLRPFGHEAVSYFFVLSGFVIAYAVDNRERTASEYAISRCARLYSVALPAVLLTAVLDWLGNYLNPASYGAGWGYADDFSAQRFLTAISFTNELWALSVRQGSNSAYWSMGYEAPFYVIFGIALFASARWRILATTLALVAAGPSIAVALPIWLAGAAAYHCTRRVTLSARTGILLFAGSALAWVLYEIGVARFGRPLIDATPLFKRVEILQDYILTPIFVLNIVGFCAAGEALGAPLLRHAKWIRWAAGATFTLYLCHLPIAQFLVAIAPWPVGDMRCRALVLLGTLVLVFLLAEFTERRKHSWRRAFERLWPWPLAQTMARPPPDSA